MPLPRASADNCGVVSGNIESVKAGGGPGDIIVHISGQNGYYYINRGLQNGTQLETLAPQLIGRHAKVYYIKYWSLLNLNT